MFSTIRRCHSYKDITKLRKMSVFPATKYSTYSVHVGKLSPLFWGSNKDQKNVWN